MSKQSISLIGVPTDIGAGHRGASMGPEALRVARLGEKLARHGLTVHDRGNLSGPLNPWQAPVEGYRHLAEVAADFAMSVLRPGGHFLTKTFQGGTESDLLNALKRNFRSVHHVKPPASRDESVELYLLAKDFKGRDDAGEGGSSA